MAPKKKEADKKRVGPVEQEAPAPKAAKKTAQESQEHPAQEQAAHEQPAQQQPIQEQPAPEQEQPAQEQPAQVAPKVSAPVAKGLGVSVIVAKEPPAPVSIVPAGKSKPFIQRPKVPSPSAAPPGACARTFMRQICPWVLQELPGRIHRLLGTGVAELSERPPLTIFSTGAVSSFKEAWTPSNCEESLRNTGLYSAAGNLGWLNPDVEENEGPNDPSWEWVYNYSETGWQLVAYKGAASGSRICCPIAFETYWPHHDRHMPSEYPSGLKLMAAHAHLWTWFVAMFRALCDNDDELVKLLYESALTATVCTRLDCTPTNLATNYLLYSERVREDSKQLVINFVTFAEKLEEICVSGKKELKSLQDMKLRFAGSLINMSMLKVANLVAKCVTQRSRDLLGDIDRRWGMDVLSGSYNKMRLLIQGCQNKGDEPSVLVSWCLETMMTMLMRKDYAPSAFTVTQFSKQRDGSASWIAQAIATRTVVRYMQSILSNVEMVDAPLANKISTEVFDKMSTPQAFHETFPLARGEPAPGTPPADATDDEVAPEDPGDLFMEELRSRLPSAGVQFAEILRKLHDNGYEKAIQILASEVDAYGKISSDSDSLGDLGKDLNEMMRSIHVAESVVGASKGGSGPPKASLRELVRKNSAPEDREAAETERADVWKRAQVQRKKLVSLTLVKDPSKKDSYFECFKKCSAVRGFKGEVNVAQRAFVVSADLMNQQGKEPWLHASPPDDALFTAAMEFVTSHRDTFDVSLGFDGLMRLPRRKLEDTFSVLPGSAEFAIVYDKAPNSCFLRKNFMSHRNVEMGYVKMPVSRTRVTVKDRAEGFGASGEMSSSYTSYSGVKAIPRTSLAMIRPEDKAKIFTDPTDSLPERWVSRGCGVPLMWMETKSQEFFTTLCDEFHIKCVVDVSPGSGILAQSCMAQGIPYLGMCSSQAHLQWLSNVLDRASLKYITESGTFLYQEDLATHITELFSDVLQSLEHVDEDEQAVQASDDEDAA